MARRVKRMSAVEVMDALSPEYGPFHWEPRYDPASELVYTILSQHTSDINSERAFKNLMATFGTLEAIAAADVKQIEDAIRRAGLFRVKAPRIKQVLNEVLDEVGSFDLTFLAEMPLRPKTGSSASTASAPRRRQSSSASRSDYAGRTHIYRVARTRPHRPQGLRRPGPRHPRAHGRSSPSTSTSSTTGARLGDPPPLRFLRPRRALPVPRHRARLAS